MVRRRPREAALHGTRGTLGVNVAAHEETIQGSYRKGGRKRALEGASSTEPAGHEESRPERSPDIVEVTPDDDGGVLVEAAKRLTREEPLELQSPLGPCEAEVHVVEHDGSRGSLGADTRMRLENAALLLRTNREIDARNIRQRKAREDRVTVPTHLEAVLRMKRHVRKAESLGEHLGLVVKVRSRMIVRDFLQERDVRPDVAQDGHDPL